MNNLPVRRSRNSRIAHPLHTLVVLAAQAVLAYRGMISANQLRSAVAPDRIHLYTRTLLTEWLLFALVALGVWLNGSSLLTILGERWRSISQLLRDIGIAGAFWIVSTIVLSLIGSGVHGKAHDTAVGFLLPHGAFEMALWTAVSISAGICEEAVYRGYLQRQFIAFAHNGPPEFCCLRSPSAVLMPTRASGERRKFASTASCLAVWPTGVRRSAPE